MLHQFELFEKCFAYDSESGALLRLDEISAAVLQLFRAHEGQRPSEAELAQLARRYSLDFSELKETADDFEQLIAEEYLFHPEHHLTLAELYPDGPKFKAMCLNICHDCNMRCTYCFAGTGDYGHERSMMSYETGCQAIDFLVRESGKRRNLDIDFFGGEPLLNWPVVKDLVYYCREIEKRSGKNLRLTLTTNCSLLSEEKIKFINEHFANVVLSIDGREKIHDKMRPFTGGRASHQFIVDKIRRFVELRGDKSYYLRGTFTAHNLDFAEDVFALAELGAQVSLEPVVAPPELDYSIGPQHLEQIKREYERLGKLLSESELRGENINFFHFNIYLQGGPCLYKRAKGCGVGTEYCAVTPTGDIYPCHQLVGEEQFILGNVATVAEEGLRSDYLGLFKRLLLPDKDACRACWARYFCSGGCAANAYFACGDPDAISEINCELQKKRLEVSLWLENERRERREMRDHA
ncbi:MAG: thioether cross-link-forming SCIFF peptide maturase [Eubacteriales bacterium]|nr:thioether cross-link-forming SCIFF peptide maturase [Eubacteriales bacterium]